MKEKNLVFEKIKEVSQGKIYENLDENEIKEKMREEFFFGVIIFSEPADDVRSDERIMIHYFFELEEYQKEIRPLEKKMFNAMKVVNKWEFNKVPFYSGNKKPIGYQIDPSSIIT